MGYDIVLHYYNTEPGGLVDEIMAHGVRCEPLRCDLSDAGAAKDLVARAAEVLPGLELLVNNASIFERSSILDTTDGLLDAHLGINLRAPYVLSRDFARIARRGQIINMIDANVLKNTSAYGAYMLSKKGLLGLTAMAAREYAPSIRVNAIGPGLILPPEGQGDEYLEEAASKRVPLKKHGHVEDVLRAMEFLITNEFITGQVLFIDGGEHLT
jgi:NAD(P)-dependent dehydrogenase (short-subunit alcohol dehydrogenase family)